MADTEVTYTLTLSEEEAHAVAAVLGRCLSNPWTTPVYDTLTEAFWGEHREDFMRTATVHADVEGADGKRRNIIEVR